MKVSEFPSVIEAKKIVKEKMRFYNEMMDMKNGQQDLELSRQLALVIGWKFYDIRMHHTLNEIQCRTKVPLGDDMHIPNWCTFDYRDWNVIGPIAEKYDCFPWWTAAGWEAEINQLVITGTPQKAIALAVIHGVKK